MPWQKVVESVPGLQVRFRPLVDGYSLTAPVREIFAAGKQNDVVTMTGSNRDESGAVPNPTVTAEEFAKQVRTRYAAADAGELLRLYPAVTDEQARTAANESARDQARVSTYLWAALRGKTAKTKAYTYYWTHALPGPEIAKYGAFHTSEVPYVFNTLYMSPRPYVEADHKIADTMSSYWANFVKTGNPNGKGLAKWAPVGDGHETMELGRRVRSDGGGGECGEVQVFGAIAVEVR